MTKRADMGANIQKKIYNVYADRVGVPRRGIETVTNTINGKIIKF